MLFVPIHVADTLVNVSQVIKEMAEHAKIQTSVVKDHIHVIEMLFVSIHVEYTLANVNPVIRETEEHVNTFSFFASSKVLVIS